MELQQADNDLAKTLNDSAQEINSHVQEQVEKKKRGPKGPRKNKPETRSLEAQAVAIKLSKEQYAQALAGVFQISGMFMVKATKFEGFALDAEEIQSLSLQGAEVCDLCMPSIDPKTLAIGGFALSVVGVYGMKYMAFKAHMEQQKKSGKMNSGVAPETKPDGKKQKD